MKIEKKRVLGSSKLGNSAKKATAAALGITTAVGLSACEEALSANSSSQPPETTPTCGEAICGHELSSSSYINISSSQEPISSSSLEALSSATKISSSSNEPLITAGVPLISSPSSSESSSSSSVAPLSSSSEDILPLSGDIAPFEDSSSSSEVQSSSSENSQKPIIVPEERCDPSSPDCFNVHLCKDSNDCMIFSMVTTFEQDDIQA